MLPEVARRDVQKSVGTAGSPCQSPPWAVYIRGCLDDPCRVAARARGACRGAQHFRPRPVRIGEKHWDGGGPRSRSIRVTASSWFQASANAGSKEVVRQARRGNVRHPWRAVAPSPQECMARCHWDGGLEDEPGASGPPSHRPSLHSHAPSLPLSQHVKAYGTHQCVVYRL